jgi:hypothetical protein
VRAWWRVVWLVWSLVWYCSCGIVRVVLFVWYCSCGIVRVVLFVWYCSCVLLIVDRYFGSTLTENPLETLSTNIDSTSIRVRSDHNNTITIQDHNTRSQYNACCCFGCMLLLMDVVCFHTRGSFPGFCLCGPTRCGTPSTRMTAHINNTDQIPNIYTT